METKQEKKKFKMPTAFTILFFIIVFMVLLSWILYWSGVSYESTRWIEEYWYLDDETSLWVHVAGHYENYVGNIKAMGILDTFLGILQGFVNRAEIIIFILVLGAFIYIVLETKSLEAFTQSISKKLGNKSIALIPILMLFFSFGGTTYGMAEETLGFYLILIPLILSMGYDKLTGLMVVLVGAGAGVLASTINPFVVAVASDAAGTDSAGNALIGSGDGMAWRWISWVIITAIAITFVTIYATRVKKNPQKSYTFATLEGDKTFFLGEKVEEIPFNKKRVATLVIFLLTFVIMVIYLIPWDLITTGSWDGPLGQAGEWVNINIPYLTALIPGFGQGYLLEVSVFFFVSSLIVAIIWWNGEENYVNSLVNGAKDMLSVCLVIATAAGVGIIMSEAGIQTLLISSLSEAVDGMHTTWFILLSFIIFLPLSFLIPSTSGFAAAIFPIWGPIAVAAGAGSGSILAFSFASGILNLFTPTSGIVMGALGLAKMDYGTFMKGMWKPILILTTTAIVLLVVGSFMPSSTIF